LGDGHVVGGVNNYLKLHKRGDKDDSIVEQEERDRELKAAKNQSISNDQKA